LGSFRQETLAGESPGPKPVAPGFRHDTVTSGQENPSM